MNATPTGLSPQARDFLENYYRRKGVGDDASERLKLLRRELDQLVSSGLQEEGELAVFEYHLLMNEGQVDPEALHLEEFPDNAKQLLDALYEAVGAQDQTQRLEYWRGQQNRQIPSASCDEEELKMREFLYLTGIKALED